MKVGAVVLAAGAGRRFGGGKLTAPWRGRPLIAWSVDAALAACAGPVVAVLGEFSADVAEVLPADPRLANIVAEDHAQGMAHSLSAGLAALPEHLDGAFIFLGDMPRIPASITASLTVALESGALAAAPAFGGQRGHPVLVSMSLVPQILALTGDRGAGGLLTALGPALTLVETSDDGVLFDVDTPADLADGG